LGGVNFSNFISFTRHTGCRDCNVRKSNPGCRDSCSQTLQSRLPGCYPLGSDNDDDSAAIRPDSRTTLCEHSRKNNSKLKYTHNANKKLSYRWQTARRV